MRSFQLQSCACTTVGRRANNEDAFLELPELGVYAVADGMGGYEGGEIASRLVVEGLAEFFRRDAGDDEATWPFACDRGLGYTEGKLDVAVRLAHRQVRARRTGALAKMGSTVAALVLRDGQAVIGHVGDSRVYRLRAGQGALEQLTQDHSLYAEMLAHAVGGMPSRADFPYTNVVTRAIGVTDEGRPELRVEAIASGDLFLLATDGLDPLEPPRIAELLSRHPPAVACPMLVEEAHHEGSKDNITAVVVRAC